jgi:tagatose-1,6-bisphosphate aldolase
MQTLSLGKYRGLQQCSTRRGTLSVLALDHRNNLRRALRPEAPDTVTDAELIAFKGQVMEGIAPEASAILLDPEFGAAQGIASGRLPGDIGLLVALDATGYTGEPEARQSQVLPGWSVAKARRMGANAVKLLVYYHPESPTASDIETLVRRVAADCVEHDIPLFLEPLSYSRDPSRKKLRPEERHLVVVETARRLTRLGADVLKAEFPLDIQAQPETEAWAEACAELSSASAIPWVLLSASVDYEMYLRQVAVAAQNGASGVAAGRAVWKEASSLAPAARVEFLHGQARERLARLTALCEALARPWTDLYAAPTLETGWYEQYGYENDQGL